MNKFLSFFKLNKGKDLKKVAEKELLKNIEVIKSLQDHDQGKKNISTSRVQRYFPNIRVTSK